MNKPASSLADWKICSLPDLASVTMGQSPDSSTYNQECKGLPFVQGNADLGNRHPIIRLFTTDPKKKSFPNDILLTVRAPVGALNINDNEIAIGRGICALNEYDKSLYLYYYLLQNQYLFLRLEQGTTFTEINQRDIKRLKINIPQDLEERKSIANILSKVDEAIEATENNLKVVEIFKKSLVQSLFTGKLKHDGTWRVENDFYIDEKFGKVPKEWEFIKLKDMIDLYQYGLNISSSDDGSIPIFRMNNIINGIMVDSPMTYIKLSAEEFQKYKLKKNDILFNRTNSLDLVGKIGIFKLEGDYAFASYLIRIRANNNNSPDYINYYFNSYKGQVSLRSKATLAVSQANINAKSLINTFLPRPPKEEQEEIVKLIKNVDIVSNIKSNKVQNLKTLKKSLMQNLLTGKVRVNVEEINKLLKKA